MVIGKTKSGKSTLLNRLLELVIFKTNIEIETNAFYTLKHENCPNYKLDLEMIDKK